MLVISEIEIGDKAVVKSGSLLYVEREIPGKCNADNPNSCFFVCV